MKLHLKAGEYELTLTGFAPWLWWLAKKMEVGFRIPLKKEEK